MASTYQACLWPRGARLVELWWRRWWCWLALGLQERGGAVGGVQCAHLETCQARSGNAAGRRGVALSPGTLDFWVLWRSDQRSPRVQRDWRRSSLVGELTCLPSCSPAASLSLYLHWNHRASRVWVRADPSTSASCFCFCSSVGLRFIDDEMLAHMDLMRE
jgi:hypothetical protein